MADMNREEVDAKIAASEARTDSQFAALLGRIDALIVRMNDFEREMREEIRGIKAEMASLRKAVILTGISSVLAILFGIAGFNAALLNNMTATYESGKEMGQWQSEVRKQSLETELSQARIRKQFEANEALQKRMTAELDQIKQERESERK
jgi:prophage DNA circulation protein